MKAKNNLMKPLKKKKRRMLLMNKMEMMPKMKK